MKADGSLRIRDVGAYLGVSHQRADQMFLEGKVPEPEVVDAIGPMWEPSRSSGGLSGSGGTRGRWPGRGSFTAPSSGASTIRVLVLDQPLS
jgi:hypothetical protein